jgi:6-phosphogluconolactonase
LRFFFTNSDSINNLESILEIFPSPYILAKTFAEKFITRINESAEKKKPLSVALSGGSTPDLLFSLLGDNFAESADWKWVHFFWGDERCVPPDNPESNYGSAYKRMLGKIDIPVANIHRIKGEEDAEKEAERYSVEISSCTSFRDGMPVFDLVMLGLGEDGHTASIFPENLNILNSDNICEVTYHPVTLQKRITLTLGVINNSESVVFLVTGRKKAEITEKIIKKIPSSRDLPASHVFPVYGQLKWFIDSEAGSLL